MQETTEGGLQPELPRRHGAVTRGEHPAFVKEQLTVMAQRWGNEKEQIALPPEKRSDYNVSHHTAEGILRLRLADLVEATYPFGYTEEAAEDATQVDAAFDMLAFPRFSLKEKLSAIRNLNRTRQLLQEEGRDPNGITLTPLQAETLAVVAERVDLPYDTSHRYFPFAPIDEQTPKRFTETEDPDVTKLLEHAPKNPDEKMTYLLHNISTLNEIQRVRLLIELPKDEFQAFVARRNQAYDELLEDMDEAPREIEDREDFMLNRTRLRYTRPAWEVNAELIRKFLDRGEEYPLGMDPVISERLWQENVDYAYRGQAPAGTDQRDREKAGVNNSKPHKR
jgi:hypothetical protein